jgi:hypothetical protein
MSEILNGIFVNFRPKLDRLPISNFLYNRAILLPQRGGDREDKELLPCSI